MQFLRSEVYAPCENLMELLPNEDLVTFLVTGVIEGRLDLHETNT